MDSAIENKKLAEEFDEFIKDLFELHPEAFEPEHRELMDHLRKESRKKKSKMRSQVQGSRIQRFGGNR